MFTRDRSNTSVAYAFRIVITSEARDLFSMAVPPGETLAMFAPAVDVVPGALDPSFAT